MEKMSVFIPLKVSLDLLVENYQLKYIKLLLEIKKRKSQIATYDNSKSTTSLVNVSLTSSPRGNDRSPENKQVFLNSSLVSKRFFQLVKGSQLCSPWLTQF